MPEYLAPGVYVEEVEIGAKPIEGISTSTAGFLGETERGPEAPRLITGLEQFLRIYGGFSWQTERKTAANSYLPYAVEGFFANGGKRCFLARIVGKNSAAASLEVSGSAATHQPRPEPVRSPATPEGEKYKITGEVLEKLKAEGFPEDVLSKLEGVKDKEFTGEEKFLEAVRETIDDNRVFGQRKAKIVEHAKTGSNPGPSRGGNPGSSFAIRALGPGSWGNRIGVKIEKASLTEVNSQLFKLVVFYWKDAPPEPPVDPMDTGKMRDPNRRQPTIQEDYDNLSPEPSSSDFYQKRINNLSSLIEVGGAATGEAPSAFGLALLEGGSDGQDVTLAEYKGANAGPGQRTGLAAFTEIDEISIVCAPNAGDHEGLDNALVEHCERLMDRFAVLQTKTSAGPVGQLRPPTDSRYAAIYYPWIKIVDPVTGMQKLVPPAGHVAGIYARTDLERGVHKAPANEVVRGAVGVQFAIAKAEQDILNPRGVNCIRTFSGRGIRVWGARTMSSDPLWKYVNVRRLMLFIEESIEEGTQWVVFEPNSQGLWDRVRQTAADFLLRVWKDGALMGNTPEEAFFVKCDETTMTPNDIESGRLIVLIGVAPVRPAEFVIFRIAQWRGGSEIAE